MSDKSGFYRRNRKAYIGRVPERNALLREIKYNNFMIILIITC